MSYKIAIVLSVFFLSSADASQPLINLKQKKKLKRSETTDERTDNSDKEKIVLNQSSEIKNPEKTPKMLPFSFGDSGSYQGYIKDESAVVTTNNPFDQQILSLELIKNAINNNFDCSKITTLDIRPPIKTLENLQELFPNLKEIMFNTPLFTEEEIKKNIDSLLQIKTLHKIKVLISN